MTISADLYSLAERARIQAMFTSVWGAANVLGPVLGGLIAMHLSWRWVFFVNVPFGALAVVLLFASYRDPSRKRGPLGIGHAVMAGSVAALAVVSLEPVSSMPHLLRAMLMLSAAALAVAFVIVQARATRPLLPHALLPDPAVRAGLVSSLFGGGLLYASTAYVPLWMTNEIHATPIYAGAALVFLLVGWAFGSSFGVRVVVRHGMKASVGGGFSIAFVGVSMLAAIITWHLPVGLAFLALFITGMGVGPASSTSLVVPQTHAPWQSRGAITSVIYATRSLGGSIAVAALGGVDHSAALRFAALSLATMTAAALALWIAPRTA